MVNVNIYAMAYMLTFITLHT